MTLVTGRIECLDGSGGVGGNVGVGNWPLLAFRPFRPFRPFKPLEPKNCLEVLTSGILGHKAASGYYTLGKVYLAHTGSLVRAKFRIVLHSL